MYIFLGLTLLNSFENLDCNVLQAKKIKTSQKPGVDYKIVF